jgi:hypothetical protein
MEVRVNRQHPAMRVRQVTARQAPDMERHPRLAMEPQRRVMEPQQLPDMERQALAMERRPPDMEVQPLGMALQPRDMVQRMPGTELPQAGMRTPTTRLRADRSP